jgi:uncharacterized membrane protein YfhO
MKRSLKQEDLFWGGLLLFLLILVFYRWLFTAVTVYARDISQYYRPMHFLAGESIQRGIFPFWNPYVSCGQPFFASLQHALLYPVSLLGFLFPFEWAYKYIYVFHFIFAGMGLYLFLRQLDLEPAASLVGAVIFIFSGVMVSLLNLLTTLAAVSWLSYVFSFFLAAQNRKAKWPWLVLLSLALSMQFYAGQPEVMYMSLGAVIVFGLVTRFKEYQQVARILIPALGLAVLFILIELVPFCQLLKLSHRETFSSWEAQTFWSFYPGQLADLVIPSFLRQWTGAGVPLPQEWLKSVYFGLGGILLLFFGVSERQGRRIWLAFLAVALLAVFIAFGKYTFFYKLMTGVLPGLKAIRYPVKFLIIFNWCLAVMAAGGMQFLANTSQPGRNRVIVKLVFVYAGLTAILLVGGWLGYWPGQYFILGVFTVLVLLLSGLQFARRKRKYLCLAVAIALFAGSAYHIIPEEKVTAISRVRHQGEYKRVIDTLGEARFALTPKTFAVLTGAEQDTQNYSLHYQPDDLSMWESVPNMAMVGHEFIAKGYESIYLDRFYSFYGLTSFQPGPSTSRILDLLGVKYVMSLWDISDRNFSLLKENGWKIYVNRQVLPRVFTTAEEVKIDTLDGIMHKMKGKVLWQTAPAVINYGLQQVTIEAETTAAATLVLTDTYYPGWTATVDSRETAVYPAYYMMRGITIPPGRHTVVFKYQPDYFTWGALGTISAFLFCSFYFISRRTVKRM